MESVQSRRLQSLACSFSGLMNSHFPFGTGAYLHQDVGNCSTCLSAKQAIDVVHGWVARTHSWEGVIWSLSTLRRGNLPLSCSSRKSQANCWAVMHKTLTTIPVNESISGFHDCQGTLGVLWTCLLDPASMNWGTIHESHSLAEMEKKYLAQPVSWFHWACFVAEMLTPN